MAKLKRLAFGKVINKFQKLVQGKSMQTCEYFIFDSCLRSMDKR
ncbi:hypothetical protein [Rhodoferax sp.]|nr:hypothetical protein [Rhodoferax sp.]